MHLNDGHVHLMGAYQDSDEALIRELDADSVRRAILFASPLLTPPAFAVHPVVARLTGGTLVGRQLIRQVVDWRRLGANDRPDNEAVLRLIERHPSRLRGLAFLNLRIDAPGLDLLASRWIVGAKIHLLFHPTSLLAPNVGPLWDELESRQQVVLIDLGLRTWAAPELAVLASDHRDITFIAAHAPEEALSLARNLDNVYVDIAGMHMQVEHVNRAVRVAGAAKVVFGSDAPREAGGDRRHTLSIVERATLTAAERDLILSGNFERIYARFWE